MAGVAGVLCLFMAVRRAPRARAAVGLAGALLLGTGLVAALWIFIVGGEWDALASGVASSALEVAGWTLVSTGLLIGGWALLADRARGRRRCPRCAYDMGAVGGLVCPECGRRASRERERFRTRRDWRAA